MNNSPANATGGGRFRNGSRLLHGCLRVLSAALVVGGVISGASAAAQGLVTVTALKGGTAAEGNPAEFQFRRSGSSSNPLTVNLSVSDPDSAIMGAAPATVDFAVGVSTRDFAIETQPDYNADGDRTITVTVVTGTGYNPSPNPALASAEFVITDNGETAPPVPPAEVTIQTDQGTIGESSETPAMFTLTRSTTAGVLMVNVEVSETQTPGMIHPDFDRMPTVTFADGEAKADLEVPIHDDGDDEPGSYIMAKVVAGTGYVPVTPDSATVLVTDDDDPPPEPVSVTIAADDTLIGEGTAAEFTLTRMETAGTLTVTVDVSETGMMIDGMAPTTVTFTDGMDEAMLSVRTVNDDTDEDDSVITATIVDGTGYAGGTPNHEAMVTVTDDDDAPAVQVTIAADRARVIEGTAAGFTLTRTDSMGALTVNVSVTETAMMIDGPAPTTVTFVDGEATAELPVPTVSDPEVQDDSVITAMVANGTGYAAGTPDSAVVRVTDSRRTSSQIVFIRASDRDVVEGEDAVFTIYRRSVSEALTVDVDVTETGNVIGMAPASVDFASGERSATLVVTTEDDDMEEDDGVVTATLMVGLDYDVASESTASVTVADNDGSEDMGPTEPDPNLPGPPRSFEPTPGDHSVALYWIPPTDDGGSPITGYEVRTDAGAWMNVGDGTTRRHTVSGLENMQSYSFEVRAVNAAGGGAAAGPVTGIPQGPRTVVTVAAKATMDEEPPTEGDDVVFTLTRHTYGQADLLDGNVRVWVKNSREAAPEIRMVPFIRRQETADLTVTTDQNDLDEPDGMVEVRLLDEFDPGYEVPPYEVRPCNPEAGLVCNFTEDHGKASTVFEDDDPAPHVYIAGDDTVDEDAGTVTFTVTLKDETGAESAPSAFEITVDWATGDAGDVMSDPLDLAAAGEDYTAANGTLTFAAGDTEKTITVDVADDDLDELAEDFMVTLTNPTSTGDDPVMLGQDEATTTIMDNDDPPSVAITEAAPAVAEDGMVTLTVMLDAPSGLPVELDWTTGDVDGLDMYDMAVADVDYESAGGALAFEPTGHGLGTPTSMEISVSIMADALDEHDEQFAVTLTPRMSERVMGEAGGAVVTITDDDDPPSASIADMSAPEGDGMLMFDVTLSAPSGLPIVLNVMTGEVETPDDPWGMAMAEGDNADYMPITDGTVEFRPDMPGGGTPTMGSVTVTVTADMFDEHDEVFGVTLSPAMPAYVTLEDAMATGTIEDDDDMPVIGVASASGYEAAGTITFTVSLSGESGLPIGVDWMTGASMTADPLDMAMAEGDHADYGPDSGMLMFAPHETEQMVMISVVDDGFDEHNEDFMVSLANATYATMGEATATGTIMDDDDPPTVSIADVLGDEGDGMFTFMLTLTGESGLPISVDVATGDHATPLDEYGMAMAGDDYGAIDDTYNIAAHTTELAVPVMIVADDLDEHHEVFSVSLSNGMYVNLGNAYAVGTIRDDDSAPMLSISDASGEESAGELTFTISLSGPSGLPISAHWSTGDADMMEAAHSGATADVDYKSASGIAEFAPGVTEMMVSVMVMDDDLDENDESFAVTLGEGSYAMLGDAQGIGTIMDDDNPPTLSVVDAMAAEGDGSLAFTVSLDAPSGLPVTVAWWTGDVEVPDGSYTQAQAGMDYTAESGTLEFAPGTTSMTVAVPLLDDALNEMDEHFAITLHNPSHAMLTDDAEAITAIGTITDDDEAPHVSIADARDDEGAPSLNFAVTLSTASALPISVDWATGDAETDDMYGMATADMDYAMSSGTLSFAAGQTEMMVSVTLMDDALDEHDEMFAVTLSNAMHAMASDAMAMGTIVDDDAAPSLSIADASGGESSGELSFMVSLSAESALPISVDYATGDMATPGDMYGMATADTDYASASGTLSFEPGMTEMAVAVTVMDDMHDEHDEVFAVHLSGAAYATLADGEATGTIEDDDNAPSVSIADASGPESVGTLDFAVTLSGMSGLPVSVHWATASDTARAGEDYENDDGTLTIPAGEPGGTVSVVVVADGVHEAEETFHVNLSGAMYATLDDAMAVGTITDDDAAPTLAISDASAAESDGSIHFTVSLTGATALPASVSWATAPGSATAGSDYQTAGGSLTFHPGESRDAMVQVMVMADAIYEGPEDFTVGLSGASNATVSDDSGTGTIHDDDAESIAKEWLARFGRTVASHVVDAVDTRVNSASGGSNASEFRLSGMWGAPTGQGLAGAHGFGPAPISRPVFDRDFNLNPAYDSGWGTQPTPYGMGQRMGDRDLGRMLAGSSFRFSAADGDSGDAWTLWGRGATTSFSGDGDTLSHDGSVTTGTVGVDYEWGDIIGGVALSLSSGDGEFEAGSDVAGELDSSMTVISPYMRVKMSCCVTIWGVAGVGQGDMTLAAEGGGAAIDTDISMSMGAAGFRGGILPDAATFDLALKSDVFVASMSADAAPGLEAVDADASRLRVVLEGSTTNELEGGGTFAPMFEVGMRYDGGDAETGTGLEVGGGLRFSDASRRFMLSLNARAMLAHAEDDYQEWGVGASAMLRPNTSGQGMTMSLRSSWGDMANGVDALWNRHNAEILARADGSLASRVGARYDAEVGYGLNAPGGRNVLVPYLSAGFTDYGMRDYGLGIRLRTDTTMDLSFEVDRREGLTDTPSHGVALRGWLYW